MGGRPEHYTYRDARTGEERSGTPRQIHENAVRRARRTGELTAYLHCGPGEHLLSQLLSPCDKHHLQVTDWLGLPFCIPGSYVRVLQPYRDSFGGQRIPLRFWGPGKKAVWSGYALGCGMYGNFRRTKFLDLYGGRKSTTKTENRRQRVRRREERAHETTLRRMREARERMAQRERRKAARGTPRRLPQALFD